MPMRIPLFLLSLLIFSVSLIAEEPSTTITSSSFGKVIKTPPSGRPKTQNAARLGFSYNPVSAECSFDLYDYIEYMTVEFQDVATGNISFDFVDAEDPRIIHPLESGIIYHIKCTTDDGSIYAGDVKIL